MQFVYFIPLTFSAAQLPEILNTVGFTTLTANQMQTRGMPGSSGPEGLPGTLLSSVSLPADRLYYRPHEQTWRKSISGKFWVGYWNVEKPCEKNLRRETVFDHYRVRLNDDAEWMVPVIRHYSGQMHMDEVMVLGSGGEIHYKPQKRYEQLCRKIEALWDDLAVETGISQEPYRLDDKQRFMLACEILQLNYYLGAEECSFMELMTKNTISAIFKAALDLPYLERALQIMEDGIKKKQEPVTAG